jgi:hypothetical protein
LNGLHKGLPKKEQGVHHFCPIRPSQLGEIMAKLGDIIKFGALLVCT